MKQQKTHEQCPNCGHRYNKFPLWKTDETGKDVFIWRNLFKMDVTTLLFLISIALILFGFYQYNENCTDFTENYKQYCEDTGCIYYESGFEEPTYPEFNPFVNKTATS